MRLSNTASRLKEIMREENLRQIDILEKAKPFCSKYDTKITKADLSQYVTGKVEPGQAKLFVLANALNVSEAWLMGYDAPKSRGPIIVNHTGISDDILLAIQLLSEESGYHLQFFAKHYQIVFDDFIVKLSPEEISDLVKCSVEQIRFVVKNIIDNKLKDNIVPIRKDTEFSSNTQKENMRSVSESVVPYAPGVKAAHNDYENETEEQEKMKSDLNNLKRPE